MEAKAIAACAGLPDPAAALQAAREALEAVHAHPFHFYSEDAYERAVPVLEAVRAALRQLNGEAQP